MSNHESNGNDQVPPYIAAFLGMLMGGIEDEEGHRKAHEATIQRWKEMRPDLAKMFNPDVADDLVLMQDLAARLCLHGQTRAASIVGLTADLLTATAGDPEVMQVGVECIKALLKMSMAQRAASKPEPRPRRKPKTKAEREAEQAAEEEARREARNRAESN